MEASKNATVLFADVSGSMKLYETAGDARAAEAIRGCINVLCSAAEANGGRVVKTIGDEVMAVFPTANAAAGAATAMHVGVEALPPIGGLKLAVRIGFQAGPIIERDDDVFGDTVNLASRLVKQAVKAQILTSEETVAQLSALVRSSVRALYPIRVKGKEQEITLCELIWRRSADLTDLAGTVSMLRLPQMRLRLRYKGRDVLRRRKKTQSVVIGREQGCHILVSDAKASRQHCTIESWQDSFVLQDHSTNGTYVTVDGEKEILLQREDLTLREHGCITFGQPRGTASDVVEFFCEQLET
jgi:adenylate cyclase